MSTLDLPRRLKACASCRDKRVACCIGSTDDSCLRCERKKIICMPGPAELKAKEHRESNDHSEIRSQLARFEAVLLAIQRQACSSGSDDHSCDRCIEVIDLVGAMTQLCFRPDGVDAGPRGKMGKNELIIETVDMLAKQTLDHVGSLDEGGFNFKPMPAQPTLRDLIDALPSEEEVFWLLDDIVMKTWTRGIDGLFWPTFPLKIRELFRSGFSPAPHPHVLAELYGVLAMAYSAVMTAKERQAENYVEQRRKWQAHIDRCAELLQRALSLGDYIATPTLEAVRALCLLAEVHICCSTSTARLARGLAILPVALNLLDQLGFHAPESDFEGDESPQEQYERRALVTTLLRVDWTYNHSFGRKAISDPRTWRVEPPTEPQDEDLPPEARQSPWRMTPMLIHSMRQRFFIARLQQEMLADVFSDHKSVAYADVKRYAGRIEALKRETMLEDWGLRDSETGERIWCKDLDISDPVQADEILARGFLSPKILKLDLTLHRAFVHPQNTSIEHGVDYKWHREVMLNACRESLQTFSSTFELVGPFCSMLSSIFDTIIGLCLLIFSNPDAPDVAKHRQELSKAIMHMVDSPAAPPAVLKLGRIAAFLLDKPKVRKAEERKPSQQDDGPKRPRRGAALTGYEAYGSLPNSAPNIKTEQFAFDFAAPIPTTTSSTAFDLAAIVDEDLWHKPPSNTGTFLPVKPRRPIVGSPTGLTALKNPKSPSAVDSDSYWTASLLANGLPVPHPISPLPRYTAASSQTMLSDSRLQSSIPPELQKRVAQQQNAMHENGASTDDLDAWLRQLTG